jgi:DNA-binding CsgD family transcriptional regulator
VNPHVPSLAVDDSALATLCMRVLEYMNIGVVACDDDLVVLAATPTAARLLKDFDPSVGAVIGERLPDPIRRAAIVYMQQSESSGRRRVAPLRLESNVSRQAVYVASKHIDRLPPATVAVRLHQEHLTDVELFEALRAKFDLNARDRRLIALLRRRLGNAEIAAALKLTVGTVKVYVHELFEKLDVHSRGELLAVIDSVRKGR